MCIEDSDAPLPKMWEGGGSTNHLLLVRTPLMVSKYEQHDAPHPPILCVCQLHKPLTHSHQNHPSPTQPPMSTAAIGPCPCSPRQRT